MNFVDSPLSYLSAALTQMLSLQSPAVAAASSAIFHWLVLLVVGMFTVETLFVGLDARHAVKLAFTIMVCSLMVHYYSVPLPFAGTSFHGLITDTAAYWRDAFEGGATQALQDRLNTVYANMQAPTLTRWSAAFYYWVAVGAIIFLSLGLVAIIGFSFIAMGICTLIGPLFVPWMIFPGFEHVFWNWLNAYIQYAMVQVIAAAFVSVYANAFIRFTDQFGMAPISLADLEAKFIVFVVFILVGGYGSFQIPSLTNSIASGRSGEGLIRI